MGDWKLDVDGSTKDFETDYSFKVKSYPGTGHSPVTNRFSPYALQDGALYTGQKMGVRQFTLIGTLYGATTLAAFHTKRQALIKALSSRTVAISAKPAPIRLSYTGATVTKEIYCYYDGGLELAQFTPFIENNIPLRFTAYDPQWQAAADTVVNLNTDIAATTEPAFGIASRVGNIWTDWGGLGSNSSYVNDLIVVGDDIYIGGSFNSVGDVSAKSMAKYKDGAWTAVEAGGMGTVYAFAHDAASNSLYVGGIFTEVNGVTASRVAKYNTITGVWTALAGGIDGNGVVVHALEWDSINSLLYIGGTFRAAAASSYEYLAVWDGAAIATVGTGLNGACYALSYDSDNDLLYIGGAFSTAGGDAAARIASWSGTVFAALGAGLNASCWALEYDTINSLLYVGGEFSTADGDTIYGIASWDGAAFAAIGAEFGTGDHVFGLAVDSTGNIYAGGSFTVSGVIGLVKYSGVSWASQNASFTSTGSAGFVYAIGLYDGGLYIGGDFNEIAAAGYTTINYAGSEISYPIFKITRTGGTAVSVNSLINLETGAIISFSYALGNTEMLTVDFRPGRRTVTSSLFGTKWSAVLDASDIASFFLQPGNASGTNANIIALSITEAGAPTTAATLTYRISYRSLD